MTVLSIEYEEGKELVSGIELYVKAASSDVRIKLPFFEFVTVATV